MRMKLSLLALIVIVTAVIISCGGGNSSNATTAVIPATVNVSLSDPTTCSAPTGPYTNVWVTIVDVKIHTSSTASDTDPGWIDLAPTLKDSPKQVDLLGQASTQCFLAALGTSSLAPGNYQQIRLILAPNTATISGNKCGTAGANCVVLASDPTHPKTLLLSSEATTGIKIPSGQLAGGQFTVGSGQTKDLDIDFDACASILQLANGTYRLKPVLHAGEVSLNSSSINGKLVDSVGNAAIAGVKGIVALEQKDSAGVDRVIMQTTVASDGSFVFCPVTTGTYDVVAVAVNGTGGSYAATITTGVGAGTALGNVPMVAVTGTTVSQATIQGKVTSANASATGTAIDAVLSALQSVGTGTGTLTTIPLIPQMGSTLSVTTAAGATCPVNTFCFDYSLGVPAANPNVGAFASAGTTYTQATGGTVNYTVGAQAFVPGSGGTANCTPSSLTTSSNNLSTPLTVTAGTPSTAATLAFTGCQ